MIMRWFGKCTGPQLLGEKYAASLKSFMWLKNNERKVISYRCLGEKDRIWRGQLSPSRFLSDRAIERSLKITSDFPPKQVVYSRCVILNDDVL